MLALPPPSAEQRAAIDAILDGHCLTIPSVAGSGKTTCMLLAASQLPCDRTATIVTYNRSLADECRARIAACGLQGRASCYTIHGLVTRVSGRTCNDDHKLNQVVDEWEGMRARGGYRECGLVLDLLLLDEAQDLRPSFYKALCHIIRMSRKPQHPPLQMCLVGDPKQMLYNFPTYGNDKAKTLFMEAPECYWNEFTSPRTWVVKKLTLSYRLTPCIASFVNAIWGTSIVGGNMHVQNLPIEYICRYPFPAKNESDKDKLPTSFLGKLIDEHGPNNVLLLAQSVKNEKCPIRVHVNDLMRLKNERGERKYSFHIKESVRGFEGRADVEGKVRVWTFCGAKGCEADCVVLFGFDMMNAGRVHALNQMGVALSRARKRLIVIHGKSFIAGQCVANPYYPMLGDFEEGLSHSIRLRSDFPEYQCEIPPLNSESDQQSREEVISLRSKLTQKVMEHLEQNKILCLKQNQLPSFTKVKPADEKSIVYLASDFNYFAALEEERFLSYGSWTKESGVSDRIDYTINVQFEKTREDVSALYGEAVVYMLQWDRCGYCPSIETIVNDGILPFDTNEWYKYEEVKKLLESKKCEPLSPAHETLLSLKFKTKTKCCQVKGKELIRFLNTRITINKKRVLDERVIYFPVKAMEKIISDEQMAPYKHEIKSMYESSRKSPANWIYLANGVMAFNQYHDKWNQVGTDPKSYEKWVDSYALRKGVSRLSNLMENVPPNNGPKVSANEKAISDKDASNHIAFERELSYEFPKDQQIGGGHTQTVVGVIGICDWVGRGLLSPKGASVDLLEIKFVKELGNVNRLQVLTYCALLSLETHRSTSGMIFNARTNELEICRMEVGVACDFLLDISHFKHSGTKRPPPATGPLLENGTDLPEHAQPPSATSRSNPVNSRNVKTDKKKQTIVESRAESIPQKRKNSSLSLAADSVKPAPGKAVAFCDLTQSCPRTKSGVSTTVNGITTYDLTQDSSDESTCFAKDCPK